MGYLGSSAKGASAEEVRQLDALLNFFIAVSVLLNPAW